MSIGDNMVNIISERARALLEDNKFFSTDLNPQMKKYPGSEISLYASSDIENGIVKNLSFYGNPESWQRVLIISMASIMVGKPLARFDQLTLRECEAYLRDRNSEPALIPLEANHEADFKKLFLWIRHLSVQNIGSDYQFSSQKGPFRNLKLTDKVRELKSFLQSKEIVALYHDLPQPELLDVEELTVYLNVPYDSEREKALLDELHALGVEAFQEEELNFIPDA